MMIDPPYGPDWVAEAAVLNDRMGRLIDIVARLAEVTRRNTECMTRLAEELAEAKRQLEYEEEQRRGLRI